MGEFINVAPTGVEDELCGMTKEGESESGFLKIWGVKTMCRTMEFYAWVHSREVLHGGL